MALSKEFSKPAETNPGFFPLNPSFSEREINISPAKETGIKERIRELSQLLFAESKKGKETKTQPQNETPRTDGFEPFVNPQPAENPLFVNSYTGNFAQQMELNRKGIERVLKIAHLDGQVILTSLSPNPDGVATEKNPLKKAAPVSEGWRIEINDTRIKGRGLEKKLSDRKLQKQFIQRFNATLRNAIFKSVLKEKLTTVKDKRFNGRLVNSLLEIGLLSVFLNLDIKSLSIPFMPPIFPMPIAVTTDIALYFASIVFQNKLFTRYGRKNVDNPLEMFMLFVEIDKVARSLAFLSLKGRTLVKEIS